MLLKTRVYMLACTIMLCTAGLKAQVAPTLSNAEDFGLLAADSVVVDDTLNVRGHAGAGTFISSKVKAAASITGGGTTAAMALTNLGTARTFLSGQSGTGISGTLDDQTLTAGVYTISGDATLNDTITFDGDSTSIFIINVSGDLVMGDAFFAGMRDVYPGNIYWNVDGIVELNGYYQSRFGVFMAGGDITVNGQMYGLTALLSQGTVRINNTNSIHPLSAFYAWKNINGYSALHLINNCNLNPTPCNYITNGSFESLEPDLSNPSIPMCPEDLEMLHLACDWEGFYWPPVLPYTWNADLFSDCNGGNWPNSVPFNDYSHWSGNGQYPHNGGHNYAGIEYAYRYGYDPQDDIPPFSLTNYLNNEKLEKVLDAPLTPGRVYYMEFYTALGDISNRTAKLDVFPATYNPPMPPTYAVTPFFTSATTIPVGTPSVPWTKVAGCLSTSSSNIDVIAIKTNTASVTSTTSIDPSIYAASSLPHPYYLAYFFIDDLVLRPLADAGADYTSCTWFSNPLGVNCTPAIAGATYSWALTSGPGSATFSTPNAVTTNVNVTASGTYTFTLTVTYGSCTATDQVVVTVNAPNVTVSPGVTICNGAQTTLTAGGASSYIWTPATGLSAVTGSSVTASPTTTTTYTVTGLNGLWCAANAQVTVTVDPNCCYGVYTIPATGEYTSNITGGSYTNTTVAVRGNLVVNSNFSITNSTLIMDPGVSITINPSCTLSVNRGVFYSCNTQMWDGIEIQPGGALVIQGNSIIEDAEIAVHSINNNSSAGIASYLLTNVTFNRNYIGVKTEGRTTLTLHPGKIRGCTFDSQASVTSTNNTSLLDSPHNTQVAQTGVELYQMNYIDVGSTTSSIYLNRFKNVRYGIKALQATYNVYNNEFKNNVALSTGCGFNATTPCPYGWAIWNTKSTCTVGGNATNQPNTFQDISNGIMHEVSGNLSVKYNTFTNITSPANITTSHAIFTRNLISGQSVAITNNTFTTLEYGLTHHNNQNTGYQAASNIFNGFNSGIYGLQNSSGSMNISSNTFNQSTSSSYTGTQAINISNAVLPLSASPAITIALNNIYNVYRGITLYDLNMAQVANNTIAFHSSITGNLLRHGISSSNSNGENIHHNIIYKAGSDPTSAYMNTVYGIKVNTNSLQCLVTENQMAKMGTGMLYFNYQNAYSTVTCNYMNRNWSGLTLNNVNIGPQGQSTSMSPPNGIAQDNFWDVLPGSMSGAFEVRGTGTYTPSDFYCRTGTGFCPTLVTPVNTVVVPCGSLADPNKDVSSAPEDCGIICYDPPCIYTPVQIARDEGTYSTVTGNQRHLLHQGLVEGILADTIVIDPTDPDGEDILNFIDDVLDNTVMGRLYTAADTFAKGDTAQAIYLNQSAKPEDCANVYQQIVNTIFFETWAVGVYEFSPADSLMLDSIAHLNPADCGSAIYDARVMLGLDINDDLAGEEEKSMLQAGTLIQDQLGVLYPNPAQNKCTYEVTLDGHKSGMIVITDLNGKTLMGGKLNPGRNTLDLDISALENGVYMYRIFVNGVDTDCKKLIINR